MKVLITLILQYQEHLAELEQNIDALAEEMEEYELIQSIPGIGHKIAATILSEIGEVDRFDHPKKLVAFAGIDPSVFASGKYSNSKPNHETWFQATTLLAGDGCIVWAYSLPKYANQSVL